MDQLDNCHILPGQCNIVVRAILVKLTFFENIKWHIVLHLFHKKFVIKKSMILVKFKKQNVVCTHKFSRFCKKKRPRKSYVPHTTYLEFWLLLQAPFLLRIFFQQISNCIFFCTFSLKNYSKRLDNFYKIKEIKCHMCT